MSGPATDAPHANKSRDEVERRMRLRQAPHVTERSRKVSEDALTLEFRGRCVE